MLPTPAAAQGGRTTIVAFRSDVPQAEHEFTHPPEQVVLAVKAVYEQIGLPLMQSSENQQDLFTPYLRVQRQLYGRNNSEFFACQEADLVGGNLADRGSVVFAILTRVRPAGGGGAVLQTQVDARATRRDVASNAVECATTGVLEKALIEMVGQILRDTAPPPAR
ncbi:MAG TPA: hypothetical protein VFS20_13195 [Longimicrobium sp.]|nr:hypothetical protein [Longimicrobium sp.]